MKVVERYPEKISPAYRRLINWTAPADPLARAVVASDVELEGTDLDPSAEHSYEVAPGVQHKYQDTVLLTVTARCASFCRYCFRKRLWASGAEHRFDAETAVSYVAEHPEIVDVVLSGGDPLLAPRRMLVKLLDEFSNISHVRTLRIGTRSPVYAPRLASNRRLLATLRRVGRRVGVYVVIHYCHPRELSPSLEAVRRLQRAGATVLAQIPVLRGINDAPGVLAELLLGVTAAGVAPYYLFQCRPTAGNAHFALTLGEAWTVFDRETAGLSGISRRARLVASHASGKLEVVGLDGDDVLMRRHRRPRGSTETTLRRVKSDAYWP